MINVASMVAQLKLNAQQFVTNIKKSQKQTKLFSNAMVMGQKGLAVFRKRMTALRSPLVQLSALLGGLGMARVVRDTLSAGASFEQMMTVVKGVSGATGEMFDRMTEAAEHYGATTEWTASQAAESLKFLSMAGFSAEQSLEALSGTLDLATAGQIGLGESADIATNILTQMGLQVSELSRVNDVLVNVQSSANTNIREAAEAWIYAGTKARTFGVEVEELGAMIGILANSGIKATMAGTTLRQSMMKLLKPTSDSQKILEKYNIEIEDGLGGVRKFTDILYDLSDANLSAIEVTTLLGARAGNLEVILRGGSDALREYIAEIKAGEGASKSLADLFRTTLIGQWKALLSAIEAVQLALFEEFRPNMEAFLKDSTAWLRENREEIVKWVKETKEFLGDIATFMKEHPDLIKYGLLALVIRGKVGAAILGAGMLTETEKQLRALVELTLGKMKELAVGMETAKLPVGFFRAPIDEAKLYRLQLAEMEADVDFFTRAVVEGAEKQGAAKKKMSKEAIKIQEQLTDRIAELTLSETNYKILQLTRAEEAARKAGVERLLTEEWMLSELVRMAEEQSAADDEARAARDEVIAAHAEEHLNFMRMQGLNEYQILDERAKKEIERVKKANKRLIKEHKITGAELIKLTKTETERIAAIKKKTEEEKNKTTFRNLNEALSMTTQNFRDIAELGAKFGRIGFRLYQTTAIAETIISTYAAAQKQFEALSSYPPLAYAAAGLAVAAGLARVAMITQQEPPSYDQGGVSTRPGMYYAGVPEAHIPLEGGSVPVRIIREEGEESILQSNITLQIDGDTFSNFIVEQVYDRTKDGDQVVHVRGITEI